MAAAPAAAVERNLRRFIAPPRVVENSLAFENDGLLAHTQRECNHSDVLAGCLLGQRACKCLIGAACATPESGPNPFVNLLCERLAGRANLRKPASKNGRVQWRHRDGVTTGNAVQ